MFSWPALIAFVLGALGLISSLLDKEKTPKRFKGTVILSLVLLTLGFWLERKGATAELIEAKSRNESLDLRIDSLRIVAEKSLRKQDSLQELLALVAHKEYPHLPEIDALKKLTEEDLHRQAVVAAGDFKRVLARMDTHFKEKSLDSLTRDYRSRNLYDSGVFLKGILVMAQDYRRARDIFIDSAIIRIEQLGTNTDTLTYPKRLPVKIGTLLVSHAKRMRMDYRAYPELQRHDTL